MEESRRNCPRVKAHLGQDLCHFDAVNDVGLTRHSHLALMRSICLFVGTAYQLQLNTTEVLRYPLDQPFVYYGQRPGHSLRGFPITVPHTCNSRNRLLFPI
jgi:hypothetical protein